MKATDAIGKHKLRLSIDVRRIAAAWRWMKRKGIIKGG